MGNDLRMLLISSIFPFSYEQDMGAVRGRDPCKHKRNLSRSRDNFDMGMMCFVIISFVVE